MSDELELYRKKIKHDISDFINSNRLDEASKLLMEYENIIKNDIDTYSIKGVIAIMRGDMEEAEKSLLDGLDMEIDNFDINFNLAYLYEIKQKYINSYRYYKKLTIIASEEYKNIISDKVERLKKISVVNEYIKRKKVLMIAYAFPPVGGPGVQRTLKFVKYLRNFGWEPIVITVDKTSISVKDKSLVKEIPKDVNVVRIDDVKIEEIDNCFINKLINMYSEVINNKELFERYMSALNTTEDFEKYMFIPEYQSVWALKIIESIDKYIDMNEIDLIYTTADPNADNFIGYFLKKKYEKLWVADFRDAWTKNPYTDYHKSDIKYEIECAMEKTLVNYADFLISATDLISRDFISDLNLHREKVETITNGYDEADFINIKKTSIKSSQFTIMYNGLFYQTRTPISFLKAIISIFNKKLIDREKLRIYFTRKDMWVDVVKEIGLDDVIQFTGYMEHEESLRKSIDSDLLLLIIGSGEESKGIYTGKVFEYLRLCKPILSLSPKDSLVDKLIHKTNRGINVEFEDIEGIENYIVNKYKEWENAIHSDFKVTQEIRKYERREQTKKLSEIFYNVIYKN